MCWNGKAASNGRWARRGRVRGMHDVFTSNGAGANETTVTTDDETS